MCATVWVLTLAVGPAQATTTLFKYTEGEQTFQVPAGVGSIEVKAVGGDGGGAGGVLGGTAAEVVGIVPVTPGQTLYVVVGGDGKDAILGGLGGFNGGAAGAAGGGGASDVRTLPLSAGLEPNDTRLIVAGGGGGGGATGLDTGGTGGDAETPGEDVEFTENYGGGAGTQGGPGLGGGGSCDAGDNGQLGLGGVGGSGCGPPGGGGGGGLYGGGGGGGANSTGGGGGGGGSSLVPAGGKKGLAAPADDPRVEITTLPAPIVVSTPAAPETKLGSHPKKTIKTKKKKVKVRFGFSSSTPGATFKCKLDKGKFAACKSPKTYKVKPGKHKFSVIASNGGVSDPTPATFSFKVKKTK